MFTNSRLFNENQENYTMQHIGVLYNTAIRQLAIENNPKGKETIQKNIYILRSILDTNKDLKMKESLCRREERLKSYWDSFC